MSGLEVVAAVASVATIIDFTWPKIRASLDSLKKHITSPDLSKDLVILEGAMSSIPDLMRVGAESRYAHASGVSHFVPKLRKLAYTAEDLVDELSYNELHQHVLEQASSSTVVGEKTKRTFEVLSFLPKGWANTSKEPPSIMVVSPERIQNLIEELNQVISGLKEAFNVADKLPPSVSPTTTEIPSHRVTTSTTVLKRVHGRGEEKQQMTDFLTPDPLIQGQKVSFFAITGVGGVGKTTLAQYTFNNLKNCFDLQVWICVSNAFDRKRLLQEIIAGITGAPRSQHEVIGVDALESTIKREVKDKTLLLVLDDVWSTEWMDLLPPLQFSEAKCCKIIVTTREVNNITQTRDYESKMLPLVGLQGEEFQSLFEEQAFGDKVSTEHPVLRQIGEKIARKLKGNPLAAKTVGAVLRENLEIQHWNRVFEDDLWNLGDKPGDIMPALMLSYLHLPFHLRRCFSYCALFPQDYHFDPESLVRMWIAQGYVVCTDQNERLEDLGFKYFRELVSRSFFDPYNYFYYNMHDLMHDLATSVSLDECFMYTQESSKFNEKAHHLSVNMLDPVQLPADLHHIRTLIRSGGYSGLLVPEVLKSLKSVRVMDGRVIKMSNDLGRLIHLRYLDLCWIDDREILEPLLKTIGSLYHLQTLFLYGDFEIEYPDDMNNLINLRHLEGVSESIARIPSIGKLVQLQELYQFEVGKGSLRSIGQLKEMNQLHNELRISNICLIESVDDAKNANMEMKKYLRSLSLEWCNHERACYCKDSTKIEHYDKVLECLKPHNNLEELEILNHKGSKPPSWLATQSLQCLKNICISHCNNWHRIQHLTQLPHLEQLTMRDMNLVVDLTDQKVAFPSLKELKLKNMSIVFEGISKEEGQQNCQVFPKLRTMDLDSYKNLESLTINDLSNLTKLVIYDSKFTSFNAEVMDSLKALETLQLKHCICLRSLSGPPSTLKELEIRGSYNKELKADLERFSLTSKIKYSKFF